MTAGKRSAKVTADIKKNRLYITLAGTINKSAVESIYTDVRFCVADLQPGFDVVTDLTEAQIGHLLGIPTFIKIMEYLKTHGVGRVVRVVGKAKSLFRQISRITESVQVYRPTYVATRAEAEELLSDTAAETSREGE